MLKQQEKHRAGAAAARVKLATTRYPKSTLDDAARVTLQQEEAGPAGTVGAAGAATETKATGAATVTETAAAARVSGSSRNSRGSNEYNGYQCKLSYSEGREAKGKERVKWQGGYHAAPSSPTQLPLTGR